MTFIDRLDILAKKYGMENDGEVDPSYLENKMTDMEHAVRNQLDVLWNLPNKLFNILRICADSNASSAKTEHEQKALKGYHFCYNLVRIIDYLKAHRDTVSLTEIKDGLESVLELINAEQPHFENVSALIFEMLPSGKKYDRKIRDQEYAKARKGLSRITSVAMTILDSLEKLGEGSEMGNRFKPEGAKLSQSEIMGFIRQHGDSYGIPDLETWSKLLNADPELEKELTKVIHALLRGRVPRDGERVKSIIEHIKKRPEEDKVLDHLLVKYEGINYENS
jgi:hypothetical protein